MKGTDNQAADTRREQQTYFDVSNSYSKLIVLNEETPGKAKKAAKEQQMETDSAPGASSTPTTTQPGKTPLLEEERQRGERKARQPVTATKAFSSKSGHHIQDNSCPDHPEHSFVSTDLSKSRG